jgi:DNA mismatch repair endonuclease MutH
MSQHYQTKEDVTKEAKRILNKSLRDMMRKEDIFETENQLISYGARRKGFLGELIERFVFNLERNNRSEADFSVAGVELKTNPLRNHSTKKYVSKERLVFSMINYDEIVKETWETSSFRKKNQVLLILFYLWIKEQSILDYRFKFTYLMNLLEDISDADIFQIRKDWEYIVAKIKKGEAHLLSEGDTYYLGACTKAANNTVVRDQPMSKVPAKPRAFSLKQQYLNFIIQKELLGKDVDTDSIFKKIRRIESVEDAFKEKLSPYLSMTDTEIRKILNWVDETKAKNYKRLLVNKMLGVSSNKIAELEKANITLKVITLEHTGALKESMSFPAFDYNDLLGQSWQDEKNETMSDFHLLLETQKFLFVIFQKVKGSEDVIFRKLMFWNFPMSDIAEAKRVWDKTIDCIRDGRYYDLPKISESAVAHVRPHGKDSSDTLETPQGTREIKRCFWLNAKYIEKTIENADPKP